MPDTLDVRFRLRQNTYAPKAVGCMQCWAAEVLSWTKIQCEV